MTSPSPSGTRPSGTSQTGATQGSPSRVGPPRAPSLAPCPDKPNCVSTEATQRARRMEPIPFQGEPELALGRLAKIVEAMPGGEVRRREPGYLHATFTTRVMRYVDDVDLLIDPEARVVRFRSASRVGTWDLGTNRRRMREIRRRFLGAE